LKDNHEVATEIEGKIRQNVGLLVAALQGNDEVSASEDAA
jgi:recombination protein RecA